MKRLFTVFLTLTAASICGAAVISENFASDPAARGWKTFGNTNFFHWNSTNQNLEVTWDSSQPNSFFYHPLTNLLTKADDFSFAFDLRLDDLAVGVNPDKPFTFPLCTGLQNFGDATKTNFYRGSGNGGSCSNLAEFAFYPDSGYGDTVWTSFWSTTARLSYNNDSDYTKISLPFGVAMRITITYTATNQLIQTSITTNGTPIGTIKSFKLATNFTDFRVDTFAVENFSDAGQRPGDQGSLLAHGVVDNFLITIPPPPVQNFGGAFSNGQWQAQFLSRTNWNYVLERSQNLANWAETSVKTNGNGGTIFLPDTNSPPAGSQFYRVKAQHL